MIRKIKILVVLGFVGLTLACTPAQFSKEEQPIRPAYIPPPPPVPPYTPPVFTVAKNTNPELDATLLTPVQGAVLDIQGSAHGLVDDIKINSWSGITVGFHYIPNPGFVGLDTINYRIIFSTGQILNCTLLINVVDYPSNNSPTVSQPIQTIMVPASLFASGHPFVFSVADISASDPDGDSIDLTLLDDTGREWSQIIADDGLSEAEVIQGRGGSTKMQLQLDFGTVGDHYYDFNIVDNKGGQTPLKINLKVY